MTRYKLFAVVALMMVALPVVALAQGTGTIFDQLSGAFQSILALGAFTLVVSEAIDKLGWHLQAVAAQVRAVAVGVILGALGALLHLGMFSDPTACGSNAWYLCGSTVGLVAGLIANFGFTTPIGQWILSLLHIRVPDGGTTAPQPPQPSKP